MRNTLLETARRVEAAPGSVLFLGASPQPSLVVRGIVKVFLSAPDGRQVSVHYVKEGGTLGILAMVGGPPPVRLQAISPTTLIVFDEATIKGLARTDAAIGWAIAGELASIYVALLNHLAVNVFGNVRQRLCSHLLSMATREDDGVLAVRGVSQQELANAVGTAREVISRTLGALGRAGMIVAGRERIELLDPERLVNEAGSLATT